MTAPNQMTAPKPTDPTPTSTQPAPERLGLSATQLVASGLAAMSATVAASFFGVAGTVIGAALGSVLTVIGNAVYGYSLRRTQHRVRRTLDVAVAHRFAADPARVIAHTAEAAGTAEADKSAAADEAVRTGDSAATGPFRLLMHPKRLALAAAGLFVAVLAVTTGFEFASGQPLSSTVTGKHGSGVSVVGGSSKKAASTPSQSSTPGSTGSSSGQPTDSPTVTVTVTPSGSASPTETPPANTDSAAGTPSATATPTGSPAPRG
jgi:hypothetical protein